ncbi:hypothetical protein D3Y55_29905 [Mesorhizobium sp. DCY119]|nr:hypothetical protein D3Y55_29905 [Mesorhizobium sp. DCY119]
MRALFFATGSPPERADRALHRWVVRPTWLEIAATFVAIGNDVGLLANAAARLLPIFKKPLPPLPRVRVTYPAHRS